MKKRLALACATATWLGSAGSAPSEDSDGIRYYLGLRGADTNPATDIHDAWGVSLGANVSRHLGFELAIDTYEKFINVSPYGEIGEYRTWSFVPEIRVRYPLWRDRLVPYAIVGMGGAFTEFNGRKPPGFGVNVNEQNGTWMAAFGGGLEYYVADNVAVGFEIKYLLAGEQNLEVEGRDTSISSSAPLIMFAMRLLYPELHPRPLVEASSEVPTRLYGAVIAGGALPVHEQIFPGIKATTETTAYFGALDKVFGFALGANFGRHWGVELAVEGYETRLNLEDVGDIGEYASYGIIPQARLRWPLLEGRLVPYLIGGVGASYGEFNDKASAGANTSLSVNSLGIGATLGGGVEYFVARNISFSFDTKYFFSRGQSIQIDDGPERDGNLDSILFAFTLRVYLAELGK